MGFARRGSNPRVVDFYLQARRTVLHTNNGAKTTTVKTVRTGTRTRNLLLRRQAPYPLGHTDNYAQYTRSLHVIFLFSVAKLCRVL
jgi:hypothetical protein